MMKTLLIIFALSFFYGCQEETPKASSLSNVSGAKAQAELPEELEDCDDKLEKAEKEVVEVTLQGSDDAGCSIE